MDTAAQILLIIVSAVLTIFLIVLIITGVYAIKLLRRAEQVADRVESAANAVKHGATAMPFVRLIAKLINKKRKE